jgi:hypothetical protein
MNLGATLGNVAWFGSSLPEYHRYRRSLDNVEAAQRRMLDALLRRNADTRFGRESGFGGLRGWEDYNRCIPPRDYEAFRPWIDAIRTGEARVLTADPVTLLEPTSGSTGAEKLIPYTESLQREIRRAVAAWMARLFIGDTALLGGRAYWSLTPQLPNEERPDSVVPIGFDEDRAYLGKLAQRFLDLTMVTQPGLKGLHDMADFWFWSVLLLLRCEDLRLVSVWHPSYLLLLLEHMLARWDELLEALADGKRRDDLGLRVRPSPARARALERAGPDDTSRIWPHLRHISCWGDAHAARSLNDVKCQFPGAAIQEKGLVATEGIVTIPFGGRHPLALRSHFYEFIDDAGRILPAWEVREGQAYTVLITTGGGLYRYQLRDRVEVNGFLGTTPCLRFIGKADRVSDLFGEKLSEVFVSDVLQQLLGQGGESTFAMLAPHRADRATRYELYVHLDAPVADDTEARLEQALCDNPHYRLCRELGQLDAAVLVPVNADAQARFLERLRAQGHRLGDIKPATLSDQDGWRVTFGVR